MNKWVEVDPGPNDVAWALEFDLNGGTSKSPRWIASETYHREYTKHEAEAIMEANSDMTYRMVRV